MEGTTTESSRDVPEVPQKDRIEEIRDDNRVLTDCMKESQPELWQWLQDIARFGGNPIDAGVVKSADGPYGRVGFKVKLFTTQNWYSITALPPKASEDGGDSGYLGCVASSRTPRAGEDWTRGNDLADGPYCEATWHKILADIVAYELVRLGQY
jgi:hypothetical protein